MKLQDIFNNSKPIIGMIHLAGDTQKEKVSRALEELELYEQEGVDGAIIEDYCGYAEDIEPVLKASQGKFPKLIRGVNCLTDPYSSFKLAKDYGVKFIQFDNIQTRALNIELYSSLREKFPEIAVLGGVGFKYTQATGNPLEQDLKEANSRCEAIVTTGKGTGIETPIEKLIQFKELLKDFSLIVGAGVNGDNAYEQLKIADGAIIGSHFKEYSLAGYPVDKDRVREIMDIAKRVRAESV